MVAYIRSDLDFILKQIKIAEAHAAGQPLYGPGGLVPAYNVSWGLRTVDGSYNNLLHPTWGAADQPFPSLLDPVYRPVQSGTVDFDGPLGPSPAITTASNYNPSNSPGSIVMDPSLRTISNLIVDQTLDNIAAIMVALQRAGVESATEQLSIAAAIKDEYQTVKPFLEAAEEANLANVAAQRTLVAAQEAYTDNPTPENQAALDNAQVAADAAQGDADAANAALATERVDLDVMLVENGISMDGDNIQITNVAPDEGLSASFNSWFTLFGQFFDHGLDLVAKGGSGTVYVPLQPDDPLYNPGSNTNFMVLTRASINPGPNGVFGDSDDVKPQNITTSFVDQNQTYTSHPSHQVFLREYTLVNGRPEATGRMLDGEDGGLPTWLDIKTQAKDILGIELTDYHVGNLPLLATDPYGNFIPNPDINSPAFGFPQVVMVGSPPLASGTPAAPLSLVSVGPDGGDPDTLPDVTHLAVRTGHAFLDDIAHTAAPVGKLSDGDIEIGLGNLNPTQFYDQALLDAHFVTGDGRGNENIGLTAVHHVFHAEHNRLMEHTKLITLQTRDVAFINEWLDTDLTAAQVAAMPTDDAALATFANTLNWDGERLFQAAKFGTEMQYQHLVFEEFARKIQPNINVFLVPDGFDVTLNPSIVAEFAHVVYRFGHSMLTETIDRFDPAFADGSIGLIEGFLNPIEFASMNTDEMAGSIIRGMTRQLGNEIDEFVTSALRNNLLGLPLDLATINLARGRDTGVPALNAARREFYEVTNENTFLKPYESWVDFAGNLKNEASIINFIAAYGTHDLITSQTTLEGKRDAALTIITGTSFGGLAVPTDRDAFLNGSDAYAGGLSAAGKLGGLENIDLWIGGLAEKIMPFGGMLGSTFNFVFEGMMENLQSGDRFYYLQRLDGLHLFGEMENNSFAAMIMRNTDATHLPSDVFSTPGLILEVDKTKQFNDLDGDGDLESTDPVGGGLLTQVVVRDNPSTPTVDTNYLKYTGGDHVVLGGTEAADTLIAGIGDDTLYGDGGNDNLEGGHGNDIINAGAGDDIIRDMGGDDNIKAGDGNDVVHSGPGLDLVMGGTGHDFIFLGTDAGSEVFAGEGNDFIYGNKNAERILGNEGDDWIETGTFDGAPGDNFDEIFAQDGVDGHDVFLGDGGFDEFIAEGGDDIMVGSPGRGKMVGMSGWDWATYKDDVGPVNADLSRPVVFDENPTPPQNAALDGYEAVEGLSGSRFNDTLTGSNTLAEERVPFTAGGSEGYRGSQLTKEGIARIAGLQQVLGLSNAQFAALAAGAMVYSAGDIVLGGDGSDTIKGLAGDDIIDGDKWLDVRIGVYANGADGSIGTGALIASYASMTELATQMFNGTYNPGQLKIIREIKTDTTPGDIDVAVFQGNRSEYTFGATADGQIIVSHAIEDSLDGTDRLRNIEQVQFLNGGALNIIVGTPGADVLNGTPQDDLILGLDGADTLNGGAGNDILVGGPSGPPSGTFLDNFDGTASYTDNNGTPGFTFNGGWVESGGETLPTSPTTGDINIINGILRFQGDGAIDGGETITRAANLSGYTSATLSFDWQGDDLDGGENVTVQAFNGTTWDTLATLGGDQTDDFSMALTAAQIGAHTAIRFVANGSFDGGENFFVDNFAITASAVETLNGGLGDDTYSFTVGDGNDVINEFVAATNPTAGGTADRISILAPMTSIDPETGLPVLTIDALNANDNDGDTNDGDLVINYTLPTGAAQTITVASHFDGTNAQTGVERINFNNAVYAGYLLGAEDYLISRLDPANRNAGGVNLSASTANNFIVGEQATSDIITGGSGNDLIFGGTGNNDIVGGLGDDLLVGDSGNDSLDARINGDDADPEFVGELGADTMIGGGGNDTYGVDDLLDVVVEAAGAGTGTDTVQTFMAALSIENMANVENLTYLGLDGDQFVGTGNALNNVITGGDLNDTLNGLGGSDTLNGGLGDDTLNGGEGNDTALNGGDGNDIIDGGLGNDAMAGGDGDDTYFADSTTDTVSEGGDGGTDLVQFTSTTTGATFTITDGDVENLTLLGTANINGTGNGSANVITGNSGNNTLNGAGGNDTLIGGLGANSLIGGTGTDTASYADAAAGVTVSLSLATAQVTGGAGTDTLNTIENLTGSAFNDTLTASGTAAIGVANLLTGGAGVDTLVATVDNVRDTMDGGDGTDTANYAAYAAALTVNLASAAPIIVGGSGSNAANSDVLVSIENFTGGSGNDTIAGSTAANVLVGGLGNDTFNYTIGGGADTIDGGIGGTDVLNIVGAANNDVLDVIYNGGALISGFEGGTVTNVETITVNLGGNADTLSYTGSSAGVTVALGNGNNTAGTASGFTSVASILNVTGTAQADTLTGNTGNNILIGGAGVDTINGGAGADLLIGGDGADLIDSGAPNGTDQDVFRFSAASEFGDIVVNFDANGTDAQDDRVEFDGALDTAYDDANENDAFLFATGNGAAGISTVDVGTGNADIEALLLTGVGGEGVTTANLGNAALVAAAFNAEFNFTDNGVGQDLLLVINDTDGNSFSVWQWIQAGGGTAEIDAAELARIGTFTANATVTAGNFDLT